MLYNFPNCLSNRCIIKLIEDEDIKFSNILDIGSGPGFHKEIFESYGYDVFTVDSNNEHQPDSLGNYTDLDVIKDYITERSSIIDGFDLIWASHVLEHQLNVNQFLSKCYDDLKDDGWLAVTVPPAKHSIVGGHVTLWNAGILLYNLILAGFDCTEAKVKKYGYNISVIVQKKRRVPLDTLNIHYDNGDVSKIKDFFPKSLNVEEGFDGAFSECNWDNIPFDMSELANRYKGKPICIIGNGPSAESEHTENGKADFSDYGMPLWVCNGTFVYHETAEMCWMMDDITGPAADAHPDPEWYRDLIKSSNIPVVSCKSYEEYPSIVEYPLKEVIQNFGKLYFSETVNYAVAWAIMVGVSEIHFHGCDYEGCRPSERAGLEYWIGRAEARGIKIKINTKSHLCRTPEIDNVNIHVDMMYGYLEKPDFLKNNEVKVDGEERRKAS